jgi:hypothetical protein
MVLGSTALSFVGLPFLLLAVMSRNPPRRERPLLCLARSCSAVPSRADPASTLFPVMHVMRQQGFLQIRNLCRNLT